MYAIIYWRGEDKVYAYNKKDGSLKLFDKLSEADLEANKIKDSRVISIEGVVL